MVTTDERPTRINRESAAGDVTEQLTASVAFWALLA
jgi:hypothetical protein